MGISAPNHVSSLDYLLQNLARTTSEAAFSAVGHRVVHGGPRYLDPQIVDRAMLTELKRVHSFDPEHSSGGNRADGSYCREVSRHAAGCLFSTQPFHHEIPRVARLLPIPRRYEAKGIHRYGFHGLSYAYLMQELKRLAGAKAASGRVALAHLGNGASMAAVRDGRSLDTTMAFNPAAGLVMSTRSGDLDPGLVAYLTRREQMTAGNLIKW